MSRSKILDCLIGGHKTDFLWPNTITGEPDCCKYCLAEFTNFQHDYDSVKRESENIKRAWVTRCELRARQ